MVASASAVAERSRHSRKRRRPAWFTIAAAVSIAAVILLLQFGDIRRHVNVTGKRRAKGRSSSLSGRQMSNNRQGQDHSSGANGENANGDSTTYYARIMYEREMSTLIRNILAPANEEFGQYQQLGLSQGLSMMNRDMLRGLKRQVEAVVDAGIDGDVYEFGSWRGGASILMARVFDAYERYRIGNNEGSSTGTNSSSNDAATHDEHYQTKRMFYVFDTFDGFLDKQVSNDTLLQDLLLDKYWVAPLDSVRRSFVKLTSQGFVDSNVRFVKGLFEDTVPNFASNGGPNRGSIALLRLDGDLYESTRVVLEHMYDNVAVGGHVIVDDYDWRPENWAKGGDQNETKTDRRICKEAVEEFRLERNIQSPITREYARPSWTKEAGEEE